jgi:beta-glucosidase
VIRYAGYETRETWFNPSHYLTLQPDGSLNLGAKTADQATEFSKQVIGSGIASAVDAAKGADAAVVVVGSMPFINGRENDDRSDMNLASGQEALVQAVTKANPHTIVVMENSYPTTINWEQRNDPAILWTTHAGQETGHALADVLFGAYNPSGRLTQTWPQSQSQVANILNYDIIKSGQTYMYDSQPALYPFGYGLSYTTFGYSKMRLSSPSMGREGTADVSVDVTNTGSRAGKNVVQLYVHQETSRVKQPLKKLIGFRNVSLEPGQTETVRFAVKTSDLAFWDVTRSKWVVETSAYDLMVGQSSADIRQSATLAVHGETIPPQDLVGHSTEAQNFDDYSGITLAPQTQATGTAVQATAAGQWVKFGDVHFGDAVTSFSAQVAKADTSAASIELRLDNPVTGPVVGTVPVTSTGGQYNWVTATGQVSGAHGHHDLYLVFTGPLEVATFSFGR